MKCFTVQDDGELKAIEVSSYEDLSEDQVYLLVDYNKKQIFIWKGRNAPVRRKFISARAAQSMRNELGLTYKVISVEQGNETKSFGTLMKGLDSEGAAVVPTTSASPSESSVTTQTTSGPRLVPKVIPDSAKTMQSSVSPTVESPQASRKVSTTSSDTSSTSPKIAPVASPRSIPEVSLDQRTEVAPPSTPVVPPSTTPNVNTESPRTTSPTMASTPSPITAQVPPASSSSSRQDLMGPVATTQQSMASETQLRPTSGVSADLINKVTQLLEKMEKVPGMVREIVIIGDTIFTVLTEHLKLFNKEIVKLEPMEGLPDGLFPAPEYYTRLYMENGKVLFIELFKEEPADERSEFIDEMKRSLRDLTKLGL